MAINGRLKQLTADVQRLQQERRAQQAAWLNPYMARLTHDDLAVLAQTDNKAPAGRANLVHYLFDQLELSPEEGRQSPLEVERLLYPRRVAEREAKERAEQEHMDAIRLRVYTKRLLQGPCPVFETWLRERGHPVPEFVPDWIPAPPAPVSAHPDPAAPVAAEAAPPQPPRPVCALYSGTGGFELMTMSGPETVRTGQVYDLPRHIWENIERTDSRYWSIER